MCDWRVTLVSRGQNQRAGWEVVTQSLAFNQLSVKKRHMHKIKCAEPLASVHLQSNAV